MEPIAAAEAEYRRRRVIVLDDFFEPEWAERTHETLTRYPHWWYTFASEMHRDDADSQAVIEAAKAKSELDFVAGRLAYRFRRSRDHFELCDCHECVARACFRNRETVARIEAASLMSGLELSTLFSSCYRPGDFLSPHTDKDNGRLAFVWNLTKDWMPQYGGNLHMLDDSWKRVERVLVPTFNSLTLFNVEGEGRPHFVSHVAPSAPRPRLAISGWYR